MYIYIYIYMYRERDIIYRERGPYIHICIGYVYVHIRRGRLPEAGPREAGPPRLACCPYSM